MHAVARIAHHPSTTRPELRAIPCPRRTQDV
jgi:hypothetical protein